MTDTFTTLVFEVSEHIATITLDRPDVLNAFDQVMLDEFRAVWHRCRQDDDIRVVVLQANGRSFSTGVDRKKGRFRHPNPWSEDDPGHFLGAKQNRVYKPLICAVHGIAGVGLVGDGGQLPVQPGGGTLGGVLAHLDAPFRGASAGVSAGRGPGRGGGRHLRQR